MKKSVESKMNSNSIHCELFKFMDIGISVIPKQSASDPVGQIKGFPTALKRKGETGDKVRYPILSVEDDQNKKLKILCLEREKVKKYLNVLAGNLGTGPLRLL